MRMNEGENEEATTRVFYDITCDSVYFLVILQREDGD